MKLPYRPEIDGLRAVAVTAVIFYHSKITISDYKFFEGGFIGVDIFFVISGYLITSIILNEIIATNTFSFKHFYERRIRRILPTLLIVVLFSLPFAWFYLLPSSLIDFSKSIIYSLGFSSNFYFHYSGQQYAAESGLLKPFLHTWSLSVEEQFYILFPISLIILFKYFRKFLIYILISGFFISLGLAEWGSRNYSSFSFYTLPTRAWELLAGSILAYYEIKNGYRNKIEVFNKILPVIGLILIIHSFLFFDEKTFHPSFYTLSPIIGVCLIIWFSNKDEIISKILSTKIFVATGLISYSLYLWHFPIFAFARVIGLLDQHSYVKYFLIIITIIFSILSYFFVERKFRNKDIKFNKTLSIIILGYSLLIIIFSISIVNNGFKTRFEDYVNKIDAESQIYYFLKNEKNIPCLDYFYCSSNNNSKKKVFLLGDSTMAAISFDLNKKLIDHQYKFIPLTIGGCYFFKDFNQIYIRQKNLISRCNLNEISKRYELIKKNPNSIIIIGGNLPYHLLGGVSYVEFLKGNRQKFFKYKSNVSENLKKSFVKNIQELSKNNDIILIYPIPEISFSPTKKIMDEYFMGKRDVIKILKEQLFYEPYEDYSKHSKQAFNLLSSIKGEKIYKVFPHKLFCNTVKKNICVTHDDKEIFYSDGNHLSSKGAEKINILIMNEIKKIENKYN